MLIVQFLAESMAYVLVASLLAMALAEWTLPYANVFLGSAASFEYWREPTLLVSMTGAAVLLGMLAGAWPALALSSFRPLRVLKGGPGNSRNGWLMRQGLVTLQFARPVLWANLIAWPVTAYAMHRWLAGFAYHVDMAVWLFPAAAALSLVIALLTVTGHAILVARATPVAALRHE